MIVAPTEAFYVLRAVGEPAELIASTISESTMSDVEAVIVTSKNNRSEIQPLNELDEAVKTIQSGLGTVLQEVVQVNPLYFPNNENKIHEALDFDDTPKSDMAKFTAMNGNPFAVKIIGLTTEAGDDVLLGTVSYHPFDLPSYDVLLNSSSPVLN